MQLKDYYKTLGVPPTATMPQIKKSFRQLALMYHPDKNPGNMMAEATFKEIHEAYETLMDANKREAYNYKRWYNRSIREAFVEEPVHPSAVLQECMRLKKYMDSVNALRVDFDGLSYHIRQLLNDRNIGLLQQVHDENINAKVIETLLNPASVLPYNYLPVIASRLLLVAGDNAASVQRVQDFLKLQKEKNAWQKYRGLIVLTVTLLLCWIIYMVSR